jgi:hypothetical protein
VAGRDHHAETVKLCLSCHAVITLQQERSWREGLPDERYRALGWCALVQLARPFGRAVQLTALARRELLPELRSDSSTQPRPEIRTDGLAA